MVNIGVSIWSDDLIARLEKLWAAGKSAGEIAAILGHVSRNAVIGKVHRLGLTRATQAIAKRPAVTKVKRAAPAQEQVSRNAGAVIQHLRRAPPKIKPEPYVVAEPVDIAPRMLSVLELTDQTCKYGIGDVGEPGFGFCGHETAPGKPYCAGHCALTYRPPEKRERRPVYRETCQPRFGGRAA